MDKYLRKALMWNKVKELSSKGLKKTEIARELGIHRTTVSRYLQMNKEEFTSWLKKPREIRLKLDSYYHFVHESLKEYPFLSGAQIEDRLKEHFPDIPSVHSKTVYNFVQRVRKENGINKPTMENQRDFEKLPEVGYGIEAQVDFGEMKIPRKSGGRQKIWIFAMVLSRSRQKFVYLQSSPFTTASSIYAHQLAFEYFKGVPKNIIYDQDRVFMVDENYGDLLLTQEFQSYVDNENFTPVFCRKADPQSKGKIENVIKYVKNNFLKGRKFTNISSLNESVISWLDRTGNGKIHSTTRLIPKEQWEIERKYLLPIRHLLKKPLSQTRKEYKVLKDNTISFKGNYYSLPLGTYANTNSKVWLEADNSNLIITDNESNLIAVHTICYLKGKIIRLSDHRRDKSLNSKQREEKSIELLGGGKKACDFIAKIKSTKARYLNDNLRLLVSKVNNYSSDTIKNTLDFCLENNIYNASRFLELADYFKSHEEKESQLTLIKSDMPKAAIISPMVSDINDYEIMFK